MNSDERSFDEFQTLSVHLPKVQSAIGTNLFYLEWYTPFKENHPLFFLQRSQQTSDWESATMKRAQEGYDKYLPRALSRFRKLSENTHCDIIVSPPSTRTAHEPYLDETCKIHPRASNLSQYFTKQKRSGECAGDVDTKYALYLANFHTSFDSAAFNTISCAKNLLIVDDVYQSGVTVAALVQRLTEAGLRDDVIITLAVPLLIRDFRPASIHDMMEIVQSEPRL